MKTEISKHLDLEEIKEAIKRKALGNVAGKIREVSVHIHIGCEYIDDWGQEIVEETDFKHGTKMAILTGATVSWCEDEE